MIQETITIILQVAIGLGMLAVAIMIYYALVFIFFLVQCTKWEDGKFVYKRQL